MRAYWFVFVFRINRGVSCFSNSFIHFAYFLTLFACFLLHENLVFFNSYTLDDLLSSVSLALIILIVFKSKLREWDVYARVNHMIWISVMICTRHVLNQQEFLQQCRSTCSCWFEWVFIRHTKVHKLVLGVIRSNFRLLLVL